MEKVTDDEPAIQRFELTGPKRMEAGTTIQLVADCKAKLATSKLLLSAIPGNYTLYPRSIPLNSTLSAAASIISKRPHPKSRKLPSFRTN